MDRCESLRPPGPGARVLYCRAPGLLARAAREGRGGDAGESPLVVAASLASRAPLVRDACPRALARGVRAGMPVARARRLCPAALVVGLEGVEASALSRALLDRLADLSPVVEPDGPDAAFAAAVEDPAAAAGGHGDAAAGLARWAGREFGVSAAVGFGPSKNAARALAESGGLPPGRLAEADAAAWLWPEDPAVGARLARLGLATFGAVAAAGEGALCHPFGARLGRLLFLRAGGTDLTPVRALYPPPRAEARLDLSEGPVADAARLDAALARLAARAAAQLAALGRHGRRAALVLSLEGGGEAREARELDAPVRSEAEVLRVARYLAGRARAAGRVTSAVVGLRLIVEGAEGPAEAVTGGLFPEKARDREAALRAARGLLRARFGPRALVRLSEVPVDARDARLSLVEESWR